MKNLKLFVLLLAVTFTAACSLNPFNRFKQTESGISYRFHINTDDGASPEVGKLVSLELVYRDSKDTVLMDTRNLGTPFILQFIESEYSGDIFEAIGMMTVGDSATFKLDAEQFFTLTAKMPSMPETIEPGSQLTFDIKLLNVMTEEEYMVEMERMAEEQRLKQEELGRAEPGLLENFLKENNIVATPRPSGLIYIEQTKGTGAGVTSGQTVSVHYEGRLLDGTVFDSSRERGTPIEFQIGVGQVIPGWDEGISLMRAGGKAQLIIPSHLAYGPQGAGDVIPPYSTLIFDVELIEVR
ncbi:MAG TPA: FKBP-type peptidyl-prolyl cis-trans isomerase [Bacteroidales bacterium]|nr:FKBP-type peptidyl-prolyl cis-trans isomerase [Bacteroidales bacterium]